jgi:SAM-dependent methyltransferase/methyltransferase-like protein
MKHVNAPQFESLASPERHIDRVYTVARLRGVAVAHPANCRVLEIGCGRGTNVIPQAIRYPNSEFIGIDIDTDAIHSASIIIDKLDIKNCRCLNIGVEDFVNKSFEKFDYVICHGLFAWADSLVRKAILDICSKGLNSTGVALVSYNTLPGWYMRGILAHYVQVDDDPSLSVDQRLERVHLHFDNLAAKDNAPELEDEPQDALTKEIKACRLQSDGFLWHEILNRNSRGFYVRQIADLFLEHGLIFIGDSLPSRMRCWRYDELALESDLPDFTNQSASFIEKEQQLDHSFPIPFRSSLFSKVVPFQEGDSDFESIYQMYVSSHLVPFAEMPDLVSNKQEIFCAPNSVSTEVEVPIVKAALVRLRGAWPAAVFFDELYDHAVALSGASEESDRQVLARELQKFYFANMIDLHPEALPCINKLSEQPCADAFAREQARTSSWVTTTRHEYHPIDRLEAQLLDLLDGSREQGSLLNELTERLSLMGITPTHEGRLIEDSSEVGELVKDHIKSSLEIFLERGILVE